MRRGEFSSELFLPRLRPLSVDELEEIETDSDAVDADQIRDVLDVIDVPIHRAFFFSWAHEDRIDADHAAPFTNHFDLFITNVALDIVISADVRVRHDRRVCCKRENLCKAGGVDVRKINHHAERLTFTHYIPTKCGETLL